MNVALIDYGTGNLHSLAKAIEACGARASLDTPPADADAIILPGVGAFGHAAARLERIAPGLRAAIAAGVPCLGICLGMQLLLSSSEEGGAHTGLGWIKGRVLRFPDQPGLRVPHMGWNELRLGRPHALTRGVGEGSDVYFLHSYYCACDDDADVLATATHGVPFAAVLGRDNLLGIQFHPEKSQQPGLAMLRNFVRL